MALYLNRPPFSSSIVSTRYRLSSCTFSSKLTAMVFSVAEANFLCCLHICPFDDMSPVGRKKTKANKLLSGSHMSDGIRQWPFILNKDSKLKQTNSIDMEKL